MDNSEEYGLRLQSWCLERNVEYRFFLEFITSFICDDDEKISSLPNDVLEFMNFEHEIEQQGLPSLDAAETAYDWNSMLFILGTEPLP